MIKSQTYEFSETHTKHNTIKWARKSSTVDFCPLDLGAGQCAQNSKAELELELVVEMKNSKAKLTSTLGGRNDADDQLMMESQTNEFFEA